MKKKIIGIFLLLFLILLVSRIKVQAVLIDEMDASAWGWNSDFKEKVADSKYKVKAKVKRVIDKNGKEETYDVNTSISYQDGGKIMQSDYGYCKATIKITPKSGQCFYAGDKLVISYTVVEGYNKSGTTVEDYPFKIDEENTNVKASTDDKITEERTTECVYNTSHAEQYAYIIEISQIKVLGKGDNKITVNGGTYTYVNACGEHSRKLSDDDVVLEIPGVKSEEERQKQLIADSEAEVAYTLRGKNYRKIVSPNLVVEFKKRVKAVDSAAKQINSTFSEISTADATKKIKFAKTTEKDSKENNIEIQGCEAEFVITAKKTRKVECLGISGYIDGKPKSTSWHSKNIKERRKV